MNAVSLTSLLLLLFIFVGAAGGGMILVASIMDGCSLVDGGSDGGI